MPRTERIVVEFVQLLDDQESLRSREEMFSRDVGQLISEQGVLRDSEEFEQILIAMVATELAGLLSAYDVLNSDAVRGTEAFRTLEFRSAHDLRRELLASKIIAPSDEEEALQESLADIEKRGRRGDSRPAPEAIARVDAASEANR